MNPDENRIWSWDEETQKLAWRPNPFGPPELQDEVHFEIVGQDTTYTPDEIASNLNDSIDTDTIWQVCRFHVVRTQIVTKMTAENEEMGTTETKIIANLNQTSGGWTVEGDWPNDPKDKSIHRMVSIGCDHKCKYCPRDITTILAQF